MKAKVALVYRRKIPGATGDEGDVLSFPPESVDAIKEMLAEATENAFNGFKSIVRPNSKVFIKPNCFGNVPPEVYASVDPRVMEALCRLIKEEVPDCILQVGDSPSWGKILGGSRDSLTTTHLEIAARKGGADEIVYLDETPLVEVSVPNGRVLKTARVFKPLIEADVLVDFPKIKTHLQGLVSLGLKNWNGTIPWYADEEHCLSESFGSIPDSMEGSHRSDLGQKIVDLIKAIPPTVTIIDGIICLEGQGPARGGTRIDLNTIIASRDVVAADAVACSAMGINPFEVQALRIAHSEGIGEAELKNIKVEGASIAQVRKYFKRPVNDPAAAVPGVDVYQAGTCPGCMVMIRSALDDFKREMLKSGKKISLEVGILAGWNVPPPVRDYKHFFVIGNCWGYSPTSNAIKSYLRKLEEKGSRVYRYPGCAPIYICKLMFEELEKINR